MPRRKKKDPLDEPIVRPYALVVALVANSYGHSPAAQAAIYQQAVEIVVRQQCDKLMLLAARYGVDLGAPNGPLELCLRLAEKYVKGFQVVDNEPRGPGAPRQDYFDLVRAVDTRVYRDKVNVAEACRKLTREQGGPWSRENWTSLQSRYYEWYAHRKRRIDDPLTKLLRAAADRAIAKSQMSAP
jgi:hypothetical protein